MSMNLVTLLYLVASVCFIQALKGLSHPTTSIRGNLFGMIGMLIAVLTTAAIAMNTAAKPIMLCMNATSSGILVISTRLAMTAPTPPPMTSPAST